MKSQITITRKDNQVSISGIFSASNNAKYKNIGGKFEPDGKKWVFEDSESINKIIEDLFGLSETLVTVEIYDFEDIVEWGEEGISAVSYTHLDVYKRQLCLLRKKAASIRFNLRKTLLHLKNCRRSLKPWLIWKAK